MLLADYESYIATQEQVDTLYRQTLRWDRKAIHGISNMGFFTSDRCIAQYAAEIWNASPLQL
jgi:starch phosphorylase